MMQDRDIITMED